MVLDSSIIAQSSFSSVAMSFLKAVVYNTFFLFYFLCQVNSELYEKLLIVQNTYRSGVVKFHETYYMVEANSKIFSSRDLKVWFQEKDFLFDNNNPPKWAKDKNIFSPEIHIINKKYNLYFDNENEKGNYGIGVASASSPMSPFNNYGRQLVSIDNGDAFNPHIAHEGT